jgi:hypothetical protein
VRRADCIPACEAASLRATFPRFLGDGPHDTDRLAHAVKRLRAFLTGCGASPAYVDQAAQLLVDTCLDGGGPVGS